MNINHDGFQQQDIGQRSGQEDRCLCLSSEFEEYNLSTIAVADGMGGHEAGEVAAEIAIQAVEKLHQKITSEKLTDWNVIRNELDSTIHKANRDVLDATISDPSKSGMGTTLTIAVIINEEAVIGHIGDSRAYLLSKETITRLTTDHTALQDAIDRGIDVTNSGIGLNALMHCIDGSDDIRVDIYPEAESGSCFNIENKVLLLCSDGLFGTISDELIYGILSESGSVKEFTNTLIDYSKTYRSSDNVTVVALDTGGFDYAAGVSEGTLKIRKSTPSLSRKILAAFTVLLAFILLFALLEETNTINTGYLDHLKAEKTFLPSATDSIDSTDKIYPVRLISPNAESGTLQPDSVQFIWSHRQVNRVNIDCFKLEIVQSDEPGSSEYFFSISDSLFTHSISDSVVTVSPGAVHLSDEIVYKWKIIPNISAASDHCKDIDIKSSSAYEFIISKN